MSERLCEITFFLKKFIYFDLSNLALLGLSCGVPRSLVAACGI